jgi:hypothetical protein
MAVWVWRAVLMPIVAQTRPLRHYRASIIRSSVMSAPGAAELRSGDVLVETTFSSTSGDFKLLEVDAALLDDVLAGGE